MSARPALRLVDGDGEVFDVSEHNDPVEENKALRAALTRSESSNRSLKRMLAAERENARRTHPVDPAFEDWKAKLVAAGFKGKSRCRLSDDRVDAMRKMFDAGYTLDDFDLVSTGVAAFPYVVYGKRRQSGSANDVQVDIAYVCEKARRFEEAARLGAIVAKAREELSS